MNTQKIDTVDWYLKQKKDKIEREFDKKQLYVPTHNCCGNPISQPHLYHCVNFQPENETFTNRIRRHFPAYCDYDQESYGFNTQEDLLALPFVKYFKESPIKNKTFFQFSLSQSDSFISLMAEYNQGTYWWCIGQLRHSNNLTLPIWTPNYNKNKTNKTNI